MCSVGSNKCAQFIGNTFSAIFNFLVLTMEEVDVLTKVAFEMLDYD